LGPTLRTARAEDANKIARVEVEAWRDTYPLLLPEDYLVAGLDQAKKGHAWRRRLERRSQETILVVVDGDDGVVGYAAFGPDRRRGGGGELYELYVLTDHQGRGFGRALCAEVAAHLRRQGLRSLTVEVLDGNSSRFFYEALGGRLAARRRQRFAGRDLPTLVYVWDDARIAAAAQTP
jgi:ribosomal protein S18 acetylase RimI-like enzyme